MIIEKIYYSYNMQTLNISLFDESTTYNVSSVEISRTINGIVSSIEALSYADITILNNLTQPSSSSMAIISVHTDGLTYSDGSKFDSGDMLSVKVTCNGEEISSLYLDSTRFYPYKLAIIDSGYSKGGDVRSAKKLARFSFYEQMLHNAIELGIDDDARIYMDELNRMASYGVPYVKRDTCYL